jgi:hypothetical protein
MTPIMIDEYKTYLENEDLSTLASYAFQPIVQAEAKPQEEDTAEERLSHLDLALSLDPLNPQSKIWGRVEGEKKCWQFDATGVYAGRQQNSKRSPGL